ncbi:MAG: hypothetical protein KF703_07930 [Actinobacteria bacterium]|nr:hypothetical protein [Actinomycetota bacterium]
MRGRRLAALVAAALLVAGTACSRDKGSDEAFCKEVARTPTLESVVTSGSPRRPTPEWLHTLEARRA